MRDAELFRHKHQFWLRLAYLSFSADEPCVKNRLYEFSQIEFRHLKWLCETLYADGIPYDYHRDGAFGVEFHTFGDALRAAVDELGSLHERYDDSVLCERMRTDERFILSFLKECQGTTAQPLRTFDRSRRWPDASLNNEQTDALTLFLFEESYKEYELILIYLYRLARATTAAQSSSFTDLIEESHFHLRSFSEMMAKMGILALPRELHPRTYEITDMEKFLRNGIVEEENAKEECRRLSSVITDPKLSSFFEFINFQESYHIEIMKKLLEEREWKN
ncbi:MAG: iron-binding protein [Sulfuricurvum sp. MLSB]|uniref:iron-binding protein n=1 Tax=unclassified Sulfuricurvum TaxID=2632390 RepID=UPI0005077947|nr:MULTISPECIES: iron-binding protein [unclassified Sulfuricurvum]KFN39681.1 MAG: iron-binding protein [Sulfuricurvum sp. MLSB]